MQKVATVIEEIGRYMEVLEKRATAAAHTTSEDPATTSEPQRNYGELLPKLAARLDLEEDAVRTELNKLSSSVLGELSKLAEDDGTSTGMVLGEISDYVDPGNRYRKKVASTSKDAWDNFTRYLLE